VSPNWSIRSVSVSEQNAHLTHSGTKKLTHFLSQTNIIQHPTKIIQQNSKLFHVGIASMKFSIPIRFKGLRMARMVL